MHSLFCMFLAHVATRQCNFFATHELHIQKRLHSDYTAIREKEADSCVLHATTQGNLGKLRVCC